MISLALLTLYWFTPDEPCELIAGYRIWEVSSDGQHRFVDSVIGTMAWHKARKGRCYAVDTVLRYSPGAIDFCEAPECRSAVLCLP